MGPISTKLPKAQPWTEILRIAVLSQNLVHLLRPRCVLLLLIYSFNF